MRRRSRDGGGAAAEPCIVLSSYVPPVVPPTLLRCVRFLTYHPSTPVVVVCVVNVLEVPIVHRDRPIPIVHGTTTTIKSVQSPVFRMTPLRVGYPVLEVVASRR